LSNPEQTLETVEGMTPVKKDKEKAEAEEQTKNQDTEVKKKEFEGQLTQLEAMFTLDKVTHLIFFLIIELNFLFSKRLIYILMELEMKRMMMNHFFV